MDVFLFYEAVSHIEVLRILGMKCGSIGNMTFLTDIGDCQTYGSLGHDMDRVWTDISDTSEDIARKCERESDLSISEEGNTDEVIRRYNREMYIRRQIARETIYTTSYTIDLSCICICENEEFFHMVLL